MHPPLHNMSTDVAVCIIRVLLHVKSFIKVFRSLCLSVVLQYIICTSIVLLNGVSFVKRVTSS